MIVYFSVLSSVIRYDMNTSHKVDIGNDYHIDDPRWHWLVMVQCQSLVEFAQECYRFAEGAQTTLSRGLRCDRNYGRKGPDSWCLTLVFGVWELSSHFLFVFLMTRMVQYKHMHLEVSVSCGYYVNITTKVTDQLCNLIHFNSRMKIQWASVGDGKRSSELMKYCKIIRFMSVY